MTTHDKSILRDLAKQYLAVCADPVQDERRNLWRRHNSLRKTRPLIYVRAFAWGEMPQSKCSCEDPLLRGAESFFRHQLFWNTFGDDSIFEPWVTVQAALKCAGWGVSGERNYSEQPRGSYKIDYPLKKLDDAEAAGDWGLCAHENQAMPYAEELEDPAANVNGVSRSQLWVYMAAQEFTAVSPAMHNEFLLQYQLPILKKFGLVAYGCCEDLTHKIDMLRQIPNLRRIAVSPFADAAKCAEQIGQDYVVSYRPSPADMVSYDHNEGRIRSILKRDLEACRDCHVDITLKDVETVQGDAERVRRWVAITREVISEVFG